MNSTFGNVIRKPKISVSLVGAGSPLPSVVDVSDDAPLYGGLMATLTLAAAAPAVSNRVNVSGNDVVALVVDTITSTSLALYGAATNASSLYPVTDSTLSEISIDVESGRVIKLSGELDGVNYFAVLPSHTETVEREITVLTVPR